MILEREGGELKISEYVSACTTRDTTQYATNKNPNFQNLLIEE